MGEEEPKTDPDYRPVKKAVRKIKEMKPSE